MATNQSFAAEPRVATQDRESPVQDAALWVELEIDRKGDTHCPIADLSSTTASGTIQLTGTNCHASISFEGEDEEHVSLYTASIEESCTCSSLCGPGFTPVDLVVEDGSLVVNAYVDDRERLSEAIEDLREGPDTWRLRRLTTPDRNKTLDSGLASQLLEDVSVTQKQREAVRVAVEMGYYDRPRDATLGDLASRLGVSRSALSQRLNAVEAKLVEGLAAEL